MAASSRLMIAEAERRFAVRVKIAAPTAGFGERLNRMHAWLDDNCGGVINDAIEVYFRDAALAAAFTAAAVTQSYESADSSAINSEGERIFSPGNRRSNHTRCWLMIVLRSRVKNTSQPFSTARRM